MRAFVLLLPCLLTLAATARADDPWRAPLDAAEAEAGPSIATELMPEVRRTAQILGAMGAIAAKRASDPAVRRLGDRVARDDASLDAAAVAFARRHHLEVAAVPRPRVVDALAYIALGAGAVSGSDFDRLFLAVTRDRSSELALRMRQLEPTIRDPALARFVRLEAPILDQQARAAGILLERGAR